ncbi:MAG: hypothetical protein MZW92_76920 [Comamonadaceae bacterium]|nr:hypothetical protein [Comamonadaceae bacterium]
MRRGWRRERRAKSVRAGRAVRAEPDPAQPRPRQRTIAAGRVPEPGATVRGRRTW